MPLAGFNLAASPTLAARVMHTSIPASRRRDRVTVRGTADMELQYCMATPRRGADKLHIVCGASPLEG